MAQINLQYLAKKLGVSVSTISKALKDYPDVSEKTKKAVIALANELNFSPNIVASNLRTQHTKTLGVIVPSIVHHYFSEVIGGIIDEAERNGYIVILLQSNEKYDLENKQLDHLIKQQVDGILLSLTVETNNFQHLERLKNRGIPFVMFDKVTDKIDCSKVIIDDEQSAFDAVSYLLRKGYKQIAYFGGSMIALNFSNRFKGYKKALKEFRIPFDKTLVYICNKKDEHKDGYSNAKKLIEDHSINGVDAVFSVTDVIAIGVTKYFCNHNIKIPENVAVFGFGNSFTSSVITPELSTVDQPGYEMGITSVKILIQEIGLSEKKVKIAFKKIVLPTSLKIRHST